MTTTDLIAFASEVLGVIAATMLLTLSPRFKQHTPISFRYPQREIIAAALVTAAAFIVGFVVFRGPSPAPITGLSGSTPTLDALLQHLTVAGAGVVLVAIALLYRRQPVRSAGWNRPLLTPAFQVGIAVILLTIFLRGKITLLFDGITTAETSALLVVTALGLAEETLFRGYVQPRLSARLGNTPGWLITAGLFALWQIPRLLGEPAETVLIGVGIGLVQGLVAGWMMQKCQHVLAPGLYRAISGWIAFLG
ncbi:MAG: CPBP family intramembrane glutamic endopeptidase [Bellilinea sp.]